MKIFFKIVFLFILIITAPTALGQAAPAASTDDDLPKKVKETKLSEVIQIPDSIMASELLKRAVNWVKAESTKYVKTGGTTNGSKAECNVTFPIKPKELNPEADYTGKITMKVVIDCKDMKYKYTVSQIKHTSKSGLVTGGSIDNVVPECGSMTMGNDNTWKKIKGEAIKGANMVVTDLKEGMDKPSTTTETEEW